MTSLIEWHPHHQLVVWNGTLEVHYSGKVVLSARQLATALEQIQSVNLDSPDTAATSDREQRIKNLVSKIRQAPALEKAKLVRELFEIEDEAWIRHCVESIE